MADREFINIHVWKETKNLLTLLAKANNLRVCEFMHRVALMLGEAEVGPDYRSIEDQDG